MFYHYSFWFQLVGWLFFMRNHHLCLCFWNMQQWKRKVIVRNRHNVIGRCRRIRYKIDYWSMLLTHKCHFADIRNDITTRWMSQRSLHRSSLFNLMSVSFVSFGTTIIILSIDIKIFLALFVITSGEVTHIMRLTRSKRKVNEYWLFVW